MGLQLVEWSGNPKQADRVVTIYLVIALMVVLVLLAEQNNGRAIDEGRQPTTEACND